MQVRAASLNGVCVLRIAGELDTTLADALPGRVSAAVRALPRPVLVDLSGLTFIDLHGARVLYGLTRTLPGGRPAVVRRCPLRVRRVFNYLGMVFDCSPAESRAAPRPSTCALANKVRLARLDAAGSLLDASGVMSRLAGNRIRLANTRERSGLLREQAREILASSRAARELRVPAARRPRP